MAIEEQCIPADATVCAFGIYSAAQQALVTGTTTDARALLLVEGDAREAGQRLASGARSSRRVAIAAVLPAAALLLFVLFAPGKWLRAVPGGSLIVEKHSARMKDALLANDLGGISRALRYIDANFVFDEGSRTPLMLVKSAEAAQILLDHGASVAAHDASGYSVLMNVAEDGSPELLRLLAGRGADVNERHPANPATSALALARQGNTPAAVEALLTAGARE